MIQASFNEASISRATDSREVQTKKWGRGWKEEQEPGLRELNTKVNTMPINASRGNCPAQQKDNACEGPKWQVLFTFPPGLGRRRRTTVPSLPPPALPRAHPPGVRLESVPVGITIKGAFGVHGLGGDFKVHQPPSNGFFSENLCGPWPLLCWTRDKHRGQLQGLGVFQASLLSRKRAQRSSLNNQFALFNQLRCTQRMERSSILREFVFCGSGSPLAGLCKCRLSVPSKAEPRKLQ